MPTTCRLFDVISTAYERTSLIVTTHLPFESWTGVLGSEPLTGATLDPLTHRCRIIDTKVSMATGFCPVMANRTAQPWPLELPSGGQ